MEWNDDQIVRLRSLWDEGLSTSEIGRRLGISKNAVVGKAHRILLPSRPSPIRRDGPSRPRPSGPRRVIGPTLPPLSASPLPELVRTLEPPPLPVVAVPTLVRTTAAPRSGRSHACCWPLGEPGTASFHFCDAETMPGKPYCMEHVQVAYVRVRDRKDEAA
jgi:GcrA cell cycle regulator